MSSQLVVDFRHSDFHDPIQRPSQAVIIQILSDYPWPYQQFNGFVGIEFWRQVQRAIHESQSIQHHRLDSTSHTHFSPAVSYLLVYLSNEVYLLTNPGYDPQVVYPLRPDLNVAHRPVFLAVDVATLAYPIIPRFLIPPCGMSALTFARWICIPNSVAEGSQRLKLVFMQSPYCCQDLS